MEDSQIVNLFWQRDEQAILETSQKYGRYCHAIANNILYNREDAEEVVNDTYIGAWNAMPPHRPAILSTFLGKITRRLSLKKWRARTAEKRRGDELAVALDELEACIPSAKSMDQTLEEWELTQIINAFLDTLPTDARRVFLRRYWYFDSISEISSRFGFGSSKVKMMLKRTREKLLVQLQKEDIWI